MVLERQLLLVGLGPSASAKQLASSVPGSAPHGCIAFYHCRSNRPCQRLPSVNHHSSPTPCQIAVPRLNRLRTTVTCTSPQPP